MSPDGGPILAPLSNGNGPRLREPRTGAVFCGIVHSSRFSFRFPQCGCSLRSGLNTWTSSRCSARSIPILACIRKSRPSADLIRTLPAVCHSSAFCSALGSFMMKLAASLRVTSRRLHGRSIWIVERLIPAFGHQVMARGSTANFIRHLARDCAHCGCARRCFEYRSARRRSTSIDRSAIASASSCRRPTSHISR
jgi:hypothetical protein